MCFLPSKCIYKHILALQIHPTLPWDQSPRLFCECTNTSLLIHLKGNNNLHFFKKELHLLVGFKNLTLTVIFLIKILKVKL